MRGVHHNLTPSVLVGRNQRTAARGRDHLVAVERQHAVSSKTTQNLPFPTAAEALGSILNDRDVVTVGDFHDAVDVVRHTIKRDRHNGFRFLACLGDSVFDGRFHQVWIDVPRVLLAVDEDGCRTEIGNRVRRRAEGERLHDDFVARLHTAGNQGEMHSGGSCRQRDHTFVKLTVVS